MRIAYNIVKLMNQRLLAMRILGVRDKAIHLSFQGVRDPKLNSINDEDTTIELDGVWGNILSGVKTVASKVAPGLLGEAVNVLGDKVMSWFQSKTVQRPESSETVAEQEAELLESEEEPTELPIDMDIDEIPIADPNIKQISEGHPTVVFGDDCIYILIPLDKTEYFLGMLTGLAGGLVKKGMKKLKGLFGKKKKRKRKRAAAAEAVVPIPPPVGVPMPTIGGNPMPGSTPYPSMNTYEENEPEQEEEERSSSGEEGDPQREEQEWDIAT